MPFEFMNHFELLLYPLLDLLRVVIEQRDNYRGFSTFIPNNYFSEDEQPRVIRGKMK